MGAAGFLAMFVAEEERKRHEREDEEDRDLEERREIARKRAIERRNREYESTQGTWFSKDK